MSFDYHRIGFFLVSGFISGIVGWYGQPLIHDNKEAVGIIVNVFSILAGFLVTIMTLLGEPSLYRGRTWRSDAVKRSNVYKRLIRHKWLFITYLLVLGLVFLTSLVTKKYPNNDAIIYLEHLYLGLAAFAFIMSLALPSRLMNLQLDRFDELVESRKNSKEK